MDGEPPTTWHELTPPAANPDHAPASRDARFPLAAEGRRGQGPRTFVRKNWSNDAPAVTAADFARLRQTTNEVRPPARRRPKEASYPLVNGPRRKPRLLQAGRR